MWRAGLPVVVDVRSELEVSIALAEGLLDFEPDVERPAPRLNYTELASIGRLFVCLDAQPTCITGLADAFLDLCAILRAEFGCLHLITGRDIPMGAAREAVYRYEPEGFHCLDLSEPRFERFLPDLYWGNWFGPPVVEFFGQEKLRTTPVYRVEEFPDGAVCLQLTQSPLDCERVPAAFHRVREAMKAHLSHNCFFDPTLPPGHTYTAPPVNKTFRAAP